MYKQLTKKLVTLVILIALLAMAVPLGFACAGASPPEASFTAEPTSGTAPLEVQFTDQSTGEITDWEWDFDDDGTVDSTEQSPSYTYEAGGKYTVSLKATGPGGSDTEIKAQYVEVTSPPEADFTAEPTSGAAPLEVQFADQSAGEITHWEWDLNNDGTVDSTEQSPSYTYEAGGKYTVSLRVSGPSGSATEVKAQYIKVAGLFPEADFTAQPTSGAPPLEVHFTDQSAGEITHWEWDFNNDGIVDSTEQNPSYIYEIGGKLTVSQKLTYPDYPETEEIKVEFTWETGAKYTVSLRVTGPGGLDTEVKAQYIQVAAPPEAGFTAEPTFGSVPVEVHFTDQSTGEITGWEWDFDNDGTVDSTEQSPSYTYEAGGEYSVSLKVTGPGGSNTETKVDYVEATTEVILTIGIMADLTGPTAPASIQIMDAIVDLARYIDEEAPIPEVKLKLVTYDMRGDPARVVPGYVWLKEKGAKVIFSPWTMAGEILKAHVEEDKVPLLIGSSTKPLIEPPGWVFCFNAPVSYQIKALLQWISEEHWDYNDGIPKIGSVGWSEPSSIELDTAIGEYCQDHPDEFEYVGGFLTPMGTMVWADQVDMLKECDYVAVPSTGMGVGIATATFAREFRDGGYTATFIGLDAVSAYLGLLVDFCSWETLDGMLTAHSTLWWNEPSFLVDLAIELLHRYRPMEAEDIVYAGSGYLGGFQQAYLFFSILWAATAQVGAENFDGQSFYDIATAFEVTYESLPRWGFTETRRYASGDVAIYEWSAAEEDLVRVSDWIPLSALEAARTELHRAQTAVAACLADAGAPTLTNWNNTTGWDGSPGLIQADGYDAADYLITTFSAYYEVQEHGDITGIGTGGETWPGVHWDDDIGNWVED